MTTTQDQVPAAVTYLLADVKGSTNGVKRLKLRTLLSKFGYSKRSDNNTAEITQFLSDAGLSINPAIVRLGDSWEISTEDWIYLSVQEFKSQPIAPSKAAVPNTWNADGWFDRITKLELRTEKEVEIKFVVPLLTRLGYTDDDRYDGMRVAAAHGARKTTLTVDFALFNASLEALRNQPLLTVEAKREELLSKKKELIHAHNQAKSYAVWTGCAFFMITDSRTIQVYQVSPGIHDEPSSSFTCERQELLDRFPDLYALLSKDTLTKYYQAKFSTAEEAC